MCASPTSKMADKKVLDLPEEMPPRPPRPSKPSEIIELSYYHPNLHDMDEVQTKT